MKTKSMHKGLSVLLAVLMLLALIPLTPFTMKASAAGTTYVLNASDLDKADKPALDGKVLKAGTDNYFTIYCDANTGINESNGDFSDLDGFIGTKRLNMGDSKFDAPANVVEFTTKGAASVKIWWKKNKADRQVAIFKPDGTAVATANEPGDANTTHITTLKVESAGKYYLGNTPKGNYIFKIEVTEEAAATATTYTFDAPKEITKFDAGAKKDGESQKFGDIFTVYYSAKSKIDGTPKTFDDGYTGDVRLNFGGGIDVATPKNTVAIKADGKGTLKLWWGSNGDTRPVVLKNAAGDIVSQTETFPKNSLAISTIDIPAAGTYYVGSDGGASYLYKFEVTIGESAPVARGDWSKVAAPVIASAEQEKNADGKLTDNIKVTVNAVIGNDGGDAVKVTLLDKDGKEVSSKQSLAEKSSHDLVLPATASGTYTVKAVLVRDGETDKAAADKTASFKLTLKTPTISSATSMGGGKVDVVWSAIPEATGYNVYSNGTKVGTAKDTKFTVSGLKVGTKYNFSVSAVRDGEESAKSAEFATTATQAAQQVWSFVRFGTSTDDANNGFVGNANDGKVTVYSEGGKGKVQPGSNDGLAFYYTALPTNKNFTFRATAHIENWVVNNGQEGFGLLAMDSVPDANNGAAAFWTNKYMAVVSKMEYRWDSEFNEITTDATLGTKYTMNLGVGVNAKQGITEDVLKKIAANDPETIKAVCGIQYPLEISAAQKGLDAGTYNIAGAKGTDAKGTSIANITDFTLEIRKNNTGYFISYYDQAGKLIGQKKFYETDALSKLDKDNVYVGFFAARSMRASFSDIKLTTTDPKNDPPAEEKPADTTRANVSIKSAGIANSENYELMLFANTDGKADVTVNGVKALTGVELKKNDRTDMTVKIAAGNNTIVINFTSAGGTTVTKTLKVNYESYFASQKNLYVSPKGTKYGNGGPEHPLDIQTAVNVVRPGQTIVVMEGTYKMTAPVTIERGIDGTKDNNINMIADPEAKSRPVFDFQNMKGGFAHGGDYWTFKGFDVCNAADGSAGIRIYGHYNTLDQVNAYHNGKTGISISTKESGSDKKEKDWPSNNLILNCTSYGNADKGYEDADGFEAKLTCGEGNVFDGCVAYNNADDGWDLFARLSSGPIGVVTIKNCVAYGNGYLEDGTNAGNGNGFKLGGDGIAVAHVIENCVSFNNKADGITSNSNPDVIVKNCTSYNNEGRNLDLRGKGDNTNFSTTGYIGFKDSNVKKGLTTAESFDPKGTQSADKYINETTYSWNGSESANSKNAKVTADMFKSLTFKGSIARNADGTINMEGFLELNDKAPKDAGARIAGKASDTIAVTPDEDLPNPGTGFAPFAVVAVMIALAAVAVLVYKRKRA